MKHNDITTTQGIKIPADPRKYKPTNSLCFGYPQNFIPSKLNTFTVPYRCTPTPLATKLRKETVVNNFD